MFRLTASAVKPNHRRQLAISGPWIAIISGLLAIATYREGTAAGPSQDQQQTKVISTDRAKDAPGQKKVDPERQLLADLDLAINAYCDHADYSRSDRELAAAFRAYGLDLDVVDPKTAGGKLAGRPSTPEITAAIDEWCRIRRTRIKVPTWHRLVEVARAADPDTWRNAVRDQFDRPPADTLPELRARAADAKTLEKQPVNSLLVLSTMLSEADDRPTAAAVLRVANKRFPDNFSVCLLRGSLAIYGAPNPDAAEAARLCATAVTQRPKSPFARINRALAFQMENKPDEAGTNSVKPSGSSPTLFGLTPNSPPPCQNRESTIKPSPNSVRRSSSSRPIPRRTSSSDMNWSKTGSWTKPWRVTARRSDSNPTAPRLTCTSVASYRNRESTTRPSPSSARRSGSRPAMPDPASASAMR